MSRARRAGEGLAKPHRLQFQEDADCGDLEVRDRADPVVHHRAALAPPRPSQLRALPPGRPSRLLSIRRPTWSSQPDGDKPLTWSCTGGNGFSSVSVTVWSAADLSVMILAFFS
jgi:hypothetical protein